MQRGSIEELQDRKCNGSETMTEDYRKPIKCPLSMFRPKSLPLEKVIGINGWKVSMLC